MPGHGMQILPWTTTLFMECLQKHWQQGHIHGMHSVYTCA